MANNDFDYIWKFYWKDGTMASSNCRFGLPPQSQPVFTLDDPRLNGFWHAAPEARAMFEAVSEGGREFDRVEVVRNE